MGRHGMVWYGLAQESMACDDWHGLARYRTIQHSTAQHGLAFLAPQSQSSTTQPSAAQHNTAQHSRILTAKAADVDRACNGGTSVPALCSIAVTSGSIHSGGTTGWVIPKSPAPVRPMVVPNAIEPMPATLQAILLIGFMRAAGQCAKLLPEVGLGKSMLQNLD